MESDFGYGETAGSGVWCLRHKLLPGPHQHDSSPTQDMNAREVQPAVAVCSRLQRDIAP